MTVQYQCMFFQTGQYGASSQDGGSLETKEWNMRSHLASGFNISHVIRELRQILRPSDWTQKTSHTGNTCNMSTSRVFDATLQWKQLGKNSTKTSTHTAAVGDDIRWDHWFLGMGQRNSPEWLIGNPIALDKASVTGRPAFEVPNSSQGEHSLPIYIYYVWICSNDVLMMFIDFPRNLPGLPDFPSHVSSMLPKRCRAASQWQPFSHALMQLLQPQRRTGAWAHAKHGGNGASIIFLGR